MSIRQPYPTPASSTLDTTTITTFTAGSVIFVGSDGTLQEDNAGIFYDDSADALRVGTLIGGTSSGGNLTLQSTTHATKGKILFGSSSAYDEVNNQIGIGVTSPSSKLDIVIGSSTEVGQIIKAASSQTADLIQFKNSAGTVIGGFAKTGYLSINAAPGLFLQPLYVKGDGSNTAFLVDGAGSATTFQINNNGAFGSSFNLYANKSGNQQSFSVGTTSTSDSIGAKKFRIKDEFAAQYRFSIDTTGLVTIYKDLQVNGKVGFYGTTPIAQPTEITDELTTITHTAPGTPDYALQDLVDSGAGSAFGFATKDEGNTLLSVVANLQARVNELETVLSTLGLVADAD